MGGGGGEQKGGKGELREGRENFVVKREGWACVCVRQLSVAPKEAWMVE